MITAKAIRERIAADEDGKLEITRDEFVTLMRAELNDFKSQVSSGYGKQRLEQWFEDFKSDVFAPRGP